MAAETRIGTTIKRARERKRMSQAELADALGVSRSAVNAWENDRAFPASSIGAIEEVLGITIYDDPATPTIEQRIEALKKLPAPERIAGLEALALGERDYWRDERDEREERERSAATQKKDQDGKPGPRPHRAAG